MRSEEGVKQFESPYKKLAYTKEFQKFFDAHPNAFRLFHGIEATLDQQDILEVSKTKNFIINGIPVEVIRAFEYQGQKHYFLKVTLDGQSFFVKSEGTTWRGKGFDEFNNTEKARKSLADIPWVKVVDALFGYQDDEGATYFVSKWLPFPLLQDYLRNIPRTPEGQEEERRLLEKVNQLRAKLPGFEQVMPHNMLYNSDPKEEKIYLFDLQTSQELPPFLENGADTF